MKTTNIDSPEFKIAAPASAVAASVIDEVFALDELHGGEQGDIAVAKVTITPDLAGEILEATNTHNRPLAEANVRILLREFTLKRWKFNGDTICFSETSRLIDGQHRLEACRRSGVSFTALVIRGLPDSVFDTKDVGRHRTAGDTLALLGEENAPKLAATLQFVDRLANDRMGHGIKYTNTEVEELARKYPGVRESVRKVVEDKTAAKLMPASVLAGCHYLFSQKNSVMADLVVEQIMRGTQLEDGDPIFVLRERLIANATSKAKLSPTYIAALFIKAWNHKRAGTTVKFLRFRESGENPETFPSVQ